MAAGALFAVPGPSDATVTIPLNGIIHHRASAARIGRRYLASLPSSVDRVRLLAMNPALAAALCRGRGRCDDLARLLRQWITDDFRRENTVVIEGWVLAATEAQLCAVIALD